MALTTALGLGFLLMIFIFFSAPAVTAVFNSEHDLQLAAYADSGLRLYFIGFLFAGINIVGTAALSAVESVKYAFCASISRGFVATIFFAFVLSACFKMDRDLAGISRCGICYNVYHFKWIIVFYKAERWNVSCKRLSRQTQTRL